MFSVDTKQSGGRHSGKEMGDSLTSTMQSETPASFLYLPGLAGGFIRELMGLTGSPRHVTTRLNIFKCFYCCVCVMCMMCDVQARVGDSVLAEVRGYLSE